MRSGGWRKAVALCAGVLLPLPLVLLLLWGLLRPEVPAEMLPGVRISPMLDNEQRMRLMTYGRNCGPGAECEPPLGCLFDARSQQCIPFKEGSSRCARVYGTNCRQTPCPDGRRCDVQYEPPHPDKVWMACVARCGEDLPPCEAGWVCDGWDCVQPCDPHGPEVCSEGYFCHPLTERMPYACQPDFWRDSAH